MCIEQEGGDENRIEKKWVAKCFPGGLSKASPRDHPPLVKDLHGKLACLGLWGQSSRAGDFCRGWGLGPQLEVQLLTIRKHSGLPNKWVKKHNILSVRIFMISGFILNVFEYAHWTLISPGLLRPLQVAGRLAGAE